jgi:hypothetical protein
VSKVSKEVNPILQAVDQIVAEADEEFYVAIRVIRDPDNLKTTGIAFMGTFSTKEAAFDRCQANFASVPLKWTPRRAREDQWDTEWVGVQDGRKCCFLVARQQVED